MSIIYDALKRVEKSSSRSATRRINIKKLILPLLIAIAGVTLPYAWQASVSLHKISQMNIDRKPEPVPLAEKEPFRQPYASLVKKPQAFILRDPFAETSPFKLSGIIYSPNKPIAIVNSKTVSIGEAVGDAKVSDIKEGSVELRLNNEKIILTLD